ncbi:hypothetical protein BHU72_07890 [Desulfuribacillus stibiiarsenatis]|uniref:M23ase beta-sheet core domain-containing protein n=1 Tax=Desulfuribacillus stibiiarsenatis TaxID=1390249 RepID=A0A1E5L3R4_9FIRM|nr:M23 family metallopeptidase [Desulfuribacillus stibiiarsenatis]OEH84745.1 hypothetical protein BHU72_07890 [Desulfuribacillus stibiiarsenatis]
MNLRPILLSVIICSFILVIGSGLLIYQQNQKAVVATITEINDLESQEIIFPKALLPLFFIENHLLSSFIHNRFDEQSIGYILSTDLQSVLNQPVQWSYIEQDKIYILTIGPRIFYVVNGTDIGQEGARFFPMRGGIIQTLENETGTELYISSDVLSYGFGLKVQEHSNVIYIHDLERALEPQIKEEVITTSSDIPIRNWNIEQRYNILQGFINPIPGTSISTRASHWPGAPRSYRNGVHEGLDFYTGTSGMIVNKQTPILAMADGVVIRADFGYTELGDSDRNVILELAKHRPITPEYILDQLRGKSVWIQHTNGVITRYVHLDRISESIVVGEEVKQGTAIGTAGNSGTSYGVIGNDEGIHLHLDIMIHGQLFWEGLKTEEIVSLLKRLFE